MAVLLEVPDPIRIAILGLIDAGLPDEDEALLELHIEILGIIDFGAKTLSIDGTLFDSSIWSTRWQAIWRCVFRWGSNPNFLFSLGGFNPNFNTDGLDVPKLARLSVSLGSGSNPRISADSYFAVTSNTVQFGANVQAYAAAGGFSIQGYLGYDVLIIISPFSFEFDFSASFDVAYDGHTLLGLNVNGTFQGPHALALSRRGFHQLAVLQGQRLGGFDVGRSTPGDDPAQPVLPDLFKAFQNPQVGARRCRPQRRSRFRSRRRTPGPDALRASDGNAAGEGNGGAARLADYQVRQRDAVRRNRVFDPERADQRAGKRFRPFRITSRQDSS